MTGELVMVDLPKQRTTAGLHQKHKYISTTERSPVATHHKRMVRFGAAGKDNLLVVIQHSFL